MKIVLVNGEFQATKITLDLNEQKLLAVNQPEPLPGEDPPPTVQIIPNEFPFVDIIEIVE
jgi:hypothetical protein